MNLIFIINLLSCPYSHLKPTVPIANRRNRAFNGKPFEAGIELDSDHHAAYFTY